MYQRTCLEFHCIGVVVQLNKGDILGHEFCGVVEAIGPDVKKVKIGKRYVASFQIACGEVMTIPSGS